MIKRILTIAALSVAAFLGLGLVASPASAAIANTAANAGACADVQDFHYIDHHLYTDRALWESAYRDSRQSSANASPALRRAIEVYLRTDRGYGRVQKDCAQVGYGQ